jgi:hypothetical protein
MAMNTAAFPVFTPESHPQFLELISISCPALQMASGIWLKIAWPSCVAHFGS